ncbi:MAG: hypothetical protein Q9O74_07545 [Planctomycetota bacterium]|nr:hypothetical protein [Planctomycetota bacterium]
MSIKDMDSARLIPLAGIMAPVTAVLIARVMLSAGPSAAPAAGLDAYDQLPPVAPVVTSPITEAQQTAIDYLASLPSGGDLRSPMAQPKVREALELPPEQLVEQIEDPTTRLVLNSIVGKGNRALASISNNIYCVGESPLPEWTITQIDTSGRVVVLRHSNGTEARLAYRVKELER